MQDKIKRIVARHLTKQAQPAVVTTKGEILAEHISDNPSIFVDALTDARSDFIKVLEDVMAGQTEDKKTLAQAIDILATKSPKDDYEQAAFAVANLALEKMLRG